MFCKYFRVFCKILAKKSESSYYVDLESDKNEEIYYEIAKNPDGSFVDKRRKYDYKTEEERLQIRREYDRILKMKKNWKINYGITIKDDEVEFFTENRLLIKKILPILEQLKKIEIN